MNTYYYAQCWAIHLYDWNIFLLIAFRLNCCVIWLSQDKTIYWNKKKFNGCRRCRCRKVQDNRCEVLPTLMAMLHVVFRMFYRKSENTLINAEELHKTSRVKFTVARAFQMVWMLIILIDTLNYVWNLVQEIYSVDLEPHIKSL